MRRTILLSCVAGMLLLSGCATYYRVTDPGTGKEYYTMQVARDGSAVRFKDAVTSEEVTIQNSRVATITQAQYEQGINPAATTQPMK